MIAGRDMEAPIASFEPAGEGGGVEDVAFDDFEISAGESAPIAVGAKESFDAMAAGIEFVNEICADKTGSAGYETVHRLLIFCGWDAWIWSGRPGLQSEYQHEDHDDGHNDGDDDLG